MGPSRENRSRPALGSQNARYMLVKKHLSRRFFRAESRAVAHVAAAIGGDRSAAIGCIPEANNCRGIATFAIWNVT